MKLGGKVLQHLDQAWYHSVIYSCNNSVGDCRSRELVRRVKQLVNLYM